MTLEKASKSSVLCAEFTWDGEVQVRLCDAPSVFEFKLAGGSYEEYLPDPYLQASPPERGGGLDEEDGSLITGLEYDFVKQATSGRAFAPISIRVFEVLVDKLNDVDNDAAVIQWDQGKCPLAQVNPQGSAASVEWTILNPKNTADSIMPLACEDSCINRFGSGKVCEFDIATNTQAGTVTAIVDNVLTIQGLTTVPLEWWPRGAVTLEGVRIEIVDFDGGNEFTLMQLPPIDWEETLPLAVSVEPGCNLLRSNCSMFDQLENFNGLGIRMERRNPLFQLPR